MNFRVKNKAKVCAKRALPAPNHPPALLGFLGTAGGLEIKLAPNAGEDGHAFPFGRRVAPFGDGEKDRLTESHVVGGHDQRHADATLGIDVVVDHHPAFGRSGTELVGRLGRNLDQGVGRRVKLLKLANTLVEITSGAFFAKLPGNALFPTDKADHTFPFEPKQDLGARGDRLAVQLGGLIFPARNHI